MSDRSTHARRPNGSGSVGARADGALIIRATDADGKRHKRIVHRGTRDDGRPWSPAQHRKRAETALAELRTQLAEPSTLRERWTLDRYFADRYHPSIVERVRPRTFESYGNEWRLFVSPTLGHVELARLTVDHVDDLDGALAARGLSLVVRRKARGLLSRVLKHAVSKRRVDRNVAQDADRLAADDRDRCKSALEPEQVKALLTAARGGPWEAAVALLALTGMRRGELLGLSWEAVDMDEATLRVERSMSTLAHGRLLLSSPKTTGSRRTLTLSAPLVASLRSHRKRQVEWRLAAGDCWSETFTADDGQDVRLVFTDEAGRPLPGHRVNDAVGRLAAIAGIGKVNPHKLRHSAASLMLAEGMDIPSVAAVLGHASPAVTMSVYAHAVGRSVARATEQLAAAIGEW